MAVMEQRGPPPMEAEAVGELAAIPIGDRAITDARSVKMNAKQPSRC